MSRVLPSSGPQTAVPGTPGFSALSGVFQAPPRSLSESGRLAASSMPSGRYCSEAVDVDRGQRGAVAGAAAVIAANHRDPHHRKRQPGGVPQLVFLRLTRDTQLETNERDPDARGNKNPPCSQASMAVAARDSRTPHSGGGHHSAPSQSHPKNRRDRGDCFGPVGENAPQSLRQRNHPLSYQATGLKECPRRRQKNDIPGGKTRVPGTACWGENARGSRLHARKEKEFATTDLVRNKLTEAGIVLEDLPDGTGWART